MCRERRLPVLHVTHDRDEAFALADECHVLIGGRVRQQGRPLQVLRQPADADVARFLGARNVLPARRDPSDPHVAVLDGGGELGVAAPLPQGDVVVVVRPEDVRLAAATAPGSLIAQVTRLTLQGGHVLVGLEAPAPLEALVPAGRLEAAGIGVGQPVVRDRAAGRRARAAGRRRAGRRTATVRPSCSQETGRDAKGILTNVTGRCGVSEIVA